MQIRSKTLHFRTICGIVERVSREHYDGNIIVHAEAKPLYYESERGFSGRIAARSSREPGARRSWSGRRMPVACWHAYRDVLRAVLERDPSATVVTMLARYKGLQGFEETYPGTANKNIGSMVQPAYMPELCDCED